MNNRDAINSNRRLWNEWTAIHEWSAMYDLAGFKAGGNRLHPLEIGEVGDVAGKTLLHLQCHFGLDTLTWAKRGAIVTGVDFSDRAVALARSIAAEMELEAEFIEASIYDLPKELDRRFDIVFTSYGVLTWLPDIWKWAMVAARCVKPGGFLYVAEFHPFAWVFSDDAGETVERAKYTYFHQEEPLVFPTQGSYAEPSAHVEQPEEYEWAHPLGDILTSLINAGLRIDYLREHPFSVYNQLPYLVQCEDGYWRLPEGMPTVPLMFSLKASKPD